LQIEDLKRLKELRSRSCKTTNPEVSGYSWHLLAANANTASKADTILGKGMYATYLFFQYLTSHKTVQGAFEDGHDIEFQSQ